MFAKHLSLKRTTECLFCVAVIIFGSLRVQAEDPSSPLGLHKVLLREDKLTKEKVFGWAVAHRSFDVELPEEGIIQVSIVPILTPGIHTDIESRAADVAERLTLAWHLMDRGATLIVEPDKRPGLFMMPPAGELKYEGRPAIYVVSQNPPLSFRVLTVFPEDVKQYGRGEAKGDARVAEFIRALIEAHFLLFGKRSTDIAEYEKLELDKTREGKIFKEICLRAMEYMESVGATEMEIRHLRDTLARIEVNQRYRLHMLSNLIPRDW